VLANNNHPIIIVRSTSTTLVRCYCYRTAIRPSDCLSVRLSTCGLRQNG